MATGEEYQETLSKAYIVNRANEQEEPQRIETPAVEPVAVVDTVPEVESVSSDYDTEQRLAEIEAEKSASEAGSELARQAGISLGQQQTQTVVTSVQEINRKREEQSQIAQQAGRQIDQIQYQIDNAERLINQGVVENPDKVRADIEKAKQDLNKYKSNIDAITSPELTPYINFSEDGSYSIDVQTALQRGVDKQVLYDAGLSRGQVAISEQKIIRGERFAEQEKDVQEKVTEIQIQDKKELAEFKDKNVELPDGYYVSNQVINQIKEQSPRAYDTLTNEGYDAYLKSYEEAIELFNKYETYDNAGNFKGYNLLNAVNDIRDITEPNREKIIQAIELLFDELTIQGVIKSDPSMYRLFPYTRNPYEIAQRETVIKKPETTSRTTAGLITAAGLVSPAAAAEPTPGGELIVLGLIAAASIAAIAAGDSINWKDEFLRIIGREPTPADVQSYQKLVGVELSGTGISPATMAKIAAEKIPFMETGDKVTYQESFALTDKQIGQIPPMPLRKERPAIEGILQEPGIAGQLIKGGVLQEPSTPSQIIDKGIIQDPISGKLFDGIVKAQTAEVETVENELLRKLIDIRNRTRNPVIPGYISDLPDTIRGILELDKAIAEGVASGEITGEEAAEYHRSRVKYNKIIKTSTLTAAGTALSGLPSKSYYVTMLPALRIINATAASVYTQALLNGATETQAMQQVKQVTSTQIKTLLQMMVKTGALTNTQAATLNKTLTDTAVQTATATSESTKTGTAVTTAESTRTAEQVIPAEAVKTTTATASLTYKGVRIPLPRISGISIIEKKKIKPGSITWKQGYDWKYIPPPYNQLKPISLGKEPPSGAKVTGRKPLDTIQIIGQAKGVPARISIDLGFVDIVILNGKEIEFAGGGLETDIGTNLSSKTKGMSKGGSLRKSKKKRKNWREELVSVKGVL